MWELVVLASSDAGVWGGEQGFCTHTNVLQDVTLPSKPHGAIYPALGRGAEQGHGATDVKPKTNASSEAKTSRDFGARL